MGSKKTTKGRHKKKTSSPKGRKFPAFLILVVCVCAVVMASLLLFNHFTGNGDQKKGVSSETFPEASQSPKVSTVDLQRLIGRWLRPDGGYVIDIRQVGSDGKMQAAYFNPRPINISRAQAKGQGADIHIFIELRDEGYPGATYDLTYNRQQDTLVGFYYQPTAGQRFDVVFLRMQ
jgi:hypothetical protein